MARDDEIQAIVEIGRRTRAPVPRGLWIAAAIVGGICTAGLAVALLRETAPGPGPGGGDPAGSAGGAGHKAPRGIDERSEETGGGDPAGSAGGAGGRAPRGIDAASPPGSGWGTGLAVGAVGGLVVGFALGRHRRDHSSRSRP